MFKYTQQLRNQQRGDFGLIHALLLVLIIVGIVVLAKKDLFPSPEIIPGYTRLKEAIPTVSFGGTNDPATPKTATATSSSNASTSTDSIPSVNNPLYQPSVNAQNETQPNFGQKQNDAEYRQLIDDANPVKIFAPEVQPKKPTPPPVAAKPKAETFPAVLTKHSGYYTVQVAATYDSRKAYGMRYELQEDGYQAYIQELEEKQGRLFKVRVGKYKNKNNARAIRDQIRRRYPERMGDSYILLRDNEH